MLPKSVNLLPNKVTIYLRDRSAKWQARVRLKTGEWYRFTTGTRDEAEDEISLRLLSLMGTYLGAFPEFLSISV